MTASLKRGDRVWHKLFEVSGYVVHAPKCSLAYVRWFNGVCTEVNVRNLVRYLNSL